MGEIYAITAALPGWRIAYIRRSPPWVQEVIPVVVWALVDSLVVEGGRRVIPMVLEGSTMLLPANPLREHVLVEPDESLEQVIADVQEGAKEDARSARKAAKVKKDRESKRAVLAAAILADPSLAPPPKDDRRIRAMAKRAAGTMKKLSLTDGESLDLLAFVLARGCEVARDTEVDAEHLFRRYERWCTAWQVRPMSRLTFSTTLATAFEGRKSGHSYEAWKGLRLLEEAEPMPEPAAERDQAGLAKFVRAYIHNSWDDDTLDENVVLASYRAWCRWNGCRPLGRKEIVEATNKTARKHGTKGAGGNLMWERMQCRWGGRR
jgi:hypothetical protein